MKKTISIILFLTILLVSNICFADSALVPSNIYGYEINFHIIIFVFFIILLIIIFSLFHLKKLKEKYKLDEIEKNENEN